MRAWARKAVVMRTRCVDCATGSVLAVACLSLGAWVIGMLARFPAGDFASPEIKCDSPEHPSSAPVSSPLEFRPI